MGFGTDLMTEICNLEAELEDTDKPPTWRRKWMIKRNLRELREVQRKHDEALLEGLRQAAKQERAR